MNILDLQNQLKNLSQEQLIQQMQAPSGDIPQFLLLNEITRRQKMRTAFEGQQNADQTTVAEDVISAAGVPGGFTGQIAGAMAPQTDMQGNTGAASQPSAMPPEQPQMMAGGGIVALRDGGRAGAPGTFVRNGIVYIVNERGEEIPWALASDVSGLDMPAAPGTPASVRANPSYSEDRSPRSALDASREPAGLFEPMLGDVSPSIPATSSMVAPFAGGLTAPVAPGRVADRLPINQAAGNLPPAAAMTASPQSMSDAVRALEEYYPGSGYADVMKGGPRAALARPIDMAPSGASDPMLAFQQNFGQDEASNIATIGRQPGIAERLFGEDALRAAGLKTAAERRSEERGPLAEDAAAPTADPLAAAEAEALAAAQTTTAQPSGIAAAAAPSGGGVTSGGPSPSGGGIASVASAAATAPNSFEQELLDMMAGREKRAQQDKWLALAQFGLQLMSSKEPTLGGAIGAAGAPALETLRSGRESSEADRLGMLNMLEQYRMSQAQLALQKQAAAARSSGSGGGGGWGGLLTPLQELQGAERAIGIAQTALENAQTSGNKGAALDAANQLEAAQRRYQEIAGTLSVFGAGPQGGSGAMFDVR
jgi:hypothetical protein